MNANIYYTVGYNNKTAFRRIKNKPKTNPIKLVLECRSWGTMSDCGQAYDKTPKFEHFSVYFSGLKRYNIK